MGGAGVTRVEVDLETGAGCGAWSAPRTGRWPTPGSPWSTRRGNVAAPRRPARTGRTLRRPGRGEYTVIATGYPPVATALRVTGAGVDDHDIELAPGE
ncbi:hypothetical protein GCM10023238_39120 [Streptomyces heliomycini]